MSGFDVRSLVNQYEFTCKLPGSGEEVKFRPLTTGQLKHLLTLDGSSDARLVENAIDDLISSCVTSEGFDVGRLYIQDRFFLLLEIRKKTKGAIYTFTYKCPVCKKENLVSISLDDLEIVEPKEMSTVIDINDSLKCVISMPTRNDYKKAFDKVDITNKSDLTVTFEMGINVITNSIRKFISNGDEIDATYEDSLYVVENTTGDFLSNMKKWTEDNDFGVDFTYTYACDCGFVRRTEVPITNFFT